MPQIGRRPFMQALGGAAAELSLASVTRDAEASGEGTQARSEPPNVLFVAFDDLNHWAEPLGGHPQTRTPHLKRFAENGINFANSYCASPSCLPSGTALMSGLYPHHNGVYTNYQHWREAFPPEAEMLPHYLMSQGYYTAGSGKVFHDANPTSWNDYFPSKEQPVVENFRPKPGQLVNMPAFPGVYTDRRSPASVMRWALARDAASAVRTAGRNDPCPCGSGKKTKRCCRNTPSHGHLSN